MKLPPFTIPFLSRIAPLSCFIALLAVPPASVPAREVQSHGLWWERWLSDTFFDGYRPPAQGHTQPWDIPAEANRRHGGLPVNPKAVKWGSPLGLGDALRQFDAGHQANATPFLLIVGFWEQVTPETKRIVHAQAVTVTPEVWRRLWHPITRSDLDKLIQVVKDPSLSLEEARARAQTIKSQPPFTLAVLQVNPKIDRSQRRLQCSLGFKAFFEHLTPQTQPEHQANPQLWGVTIPRLSDSPARSRATPASP